MRNKILLTGSNNSVIDDFFIHMDEVFEVQSSSARFEDLVSHAKYFEPEVFVYCMKMESRETMGRMIPVMSKFGGMDIPLVIIGDDDDCAEFSKVAPNISDLVIRQPIQARAIQEKIVRFLRERRRERLAKEKQKQAELEKQKELKEKKARADAEIDSILSALEAGSLAQSTASGRKHVLVVDDDVRMLRVIKEHLHETYDVATAINGKLALKFLENKRTDLILLDYVMPDEDGPAVLKRIHQNPATKDIPVIFLTGVTERGKLQEALKEKPQGYLLKPIARDKLISTIESVFH